MSESVVADFVARYSNGRRDPIQGRVLLSHKRLVLASDDERVTIPTSSIFDVAVGHVGADMKEFFDSTVTIGYRRDGEGRSAIVEADEDTVDRFSTVLFKTLLHGATASVVHPARTGGRVTDANAETARLRLGDRTVGFEGLGLQIDVSTVVGFRKIQRTMDGQQREAVSIRHMDGSGAVTTDVSLPESRRLNVLGRYVRLVYSDVREEVGDLDVTEGETEVLVALYSGASEGNLAGVLGIDPSRVTMLLTSLEEKGLVENEGGQTELTSRGLLVVGERLESVNE